MVCDPDGGGQTGKLKSVLELPLRKTFKLVEAAREMILDFVELRKDYDAAVACVPTGFPNTVPEKTLDAPMPHFISQIYRECEKRGGR